MRFNWPSPTTAGFLLSGAALAAYPAIRPYGPETGTAGAADFAATGWLVAHVLGMVGFVALALALRSATVRPILWWPGRRVRAAETRAWLAVALLLPYYGAEAYGLRALGRYASDSSDTQVLEVADMFREGPFEATTFAAGLVLLATVGGQLAMILWRAGTLARTGGLLVVLGLVTYLPQFFGPPEVRIAHGAVLGLGLALAGVAASRAGSAPTEE